MAIEKEILHIPEMAVLMGRSESAIRNATQQLPDWLPPFFKQGRRICWRLSTARQYIADFEQGAHRAPKRGRPRAVPKLSA